MQRILFILFITVGIVAGPHLSRAEKSLKGKLLLKNVYDVAISPDSKRLAYTYGQDLWTSSIEG